MVQNFANFPTKHTLSADSLFLEYDASTIRDTIDLLDSSKFNITVTSQNLYDNDVDFKLKEKWFGIEYCERDMPDKWLKLWTNAEPLPEFTLPKPNTFIPDICTTGFDDIRALRFKPSRMERKVYDFLFIGSVMINTSKE